MSYESFLLLSESGSPGGDIILLSTYSGISGSLYTTGTVSSGSPPGGDLLQYKIYLSIIKF